MSQLFFAVTKTLKTDKEKGCIFFDTSLLYILIRCENYSATTSKGISIETSL